MSKLLRYFQPEQICFITSVAVNREPILLKSRTACASFLDRIRGDSEGKLLAWVILPDHCHLLLDVGHADVSHIVKVAKLAFSYRYRLEMKLYRGTVWQARFWDHIIRDEWDFDRHLDYIHFNPVKHDYVKFARDWECSSFLSFVDNGWYDADWQIADPKSLEGDFGE